MPFSINESKVQELLKSARRDYVVSDMVVESSETNNYAPAYIVSGTTYAAPILVTAESKERLMTLRRHIEESGTPLKGADELSKEIDEMRRGNR